MAKKKAEKGTAGKYANGKPVKQPTERELDQRIEFAKDCWIHGNFKVNMISDIKERFRVSHRTASEYLSRARKAISEQTASTWAEKREESYHRYLKIATDETLPPMARIKAQTRIDQIFGLEAPVKIARTDKDGNDISREEAEDRIDSLCARIADRGRDN